VYKRQVVCRSTRESTPCGRIVFWRRGRLCTLHRTRQGPRHRCRIAVHRSRQGTLHRRHNVLQRQHQRRHNIETGPHSTIPSTVRTVAC